MNKKYSEEFKDKLKSMRASGMTYAAIADELGMKKQTVHYICTYHTEKINRYNGIAPCGFCKSNQTIVNTIKTKDYLKYYVKCKHCSARGPGVFQYSNKANEDLRSRAIELWNNVMEVKHDS